MAVDKLWLANAQDASGNLKKFRDTFTYENDAKKRAQIIMALAYLSAAGFPPALAMIEAMVCQRPFLVLSYWFLVPGLASPHR